MIREFYLPKGDKPKVPWVKNLSSKTPVYAGVLDITPAEQTSLDNDTKMWEYIMNTMLDAYNTKMQGITGFKNVMRDGPLGTPTPPIPVAPTLPAAPAAVLAGIFPRIAKFVQRLKKHPNYTVNIGEDLGIEGAEITFDPLKLKPVLKGALDANRPRVCWKKGPFIDSINIYVDRELDDKYEYLANDSEPDYIDTFPMPAGVNTAAWRYKAISVIGDEQVGEFSDPITITVTRQI